jgi:4-carboxymuconolactone decarboxylase
MPTDPASSDPQTTRDAASGPADGTASIPPELRAAWQEYLSRTVDDMWARPGLSPRDRSIATVAALTALHRPIELRSQLRRALDNGLSTRELGEVLLQVNGYAGMGAAVEGMAALGEVLAEAGEDPDRPVPDDHQWPSIEGRHERARTTLHKLTPATAEQMYAASDPYEPHAPGERLSFTAPGAWTSWLADTAFGDLWCRPGLSDREREQVTSSVLIALARSDELVPHIRAAFRFGITPEEFTEMVVHLSIYVGFPTSVEAMLLTRKVLAEDVDQPA